MRHILTGLLLPALSLGIFARTVFACPCEERPSLVKALEKASLVITARVGAVGKNPRKPGFTEIKVQVLEKFKGGEDLPSDVVIIYTPEAENNCSVDFAKGLDYIIYAQGTPAFYQTNSCTRTALLDDALLDVQRLIRILKRNQETEENEGPGSPS